MGFPDCGKIVDKPFPLSALEVGKVFITARSLFLNESLSCHRAQFPSLPLDWNDGSYSWNLGLTGAVLQSWRGKKILDIGGGASIFPEEAGLLGINVEVKDLNLAAVKEMLSVPVIPKRLPPDFAKTVGIKPDSMLTSRELLKLAYLTNLEWLYCKFSNAVPGHLRPAFDTIVKERYETMRVLHEFTGIRSIADATAPKIFGTDRYDGVISVWVLNYLSNKQRLAVLKNAIRATRVGGQIRINGGDITAQGSSKDENLTAASFRKLFAKYSNSAGAYRYRGKTVTVSGDSSGNLLVLDVSF